MNIPGSVEVNNQSYEKRGLEKMLDRLPAELNGAVNENDWMHYDMESKIAVLQHYGLYERYAKRAEMDEAGMIEHPDSRFEPAPEYRPADTPVESIPELPPTSPVGLNGGESAPASEVSAEAAVEPQVDSNYVEVTQEAPVSEQMPEQSQEAPTIEETQSQQVEQLSNQDVSDADSGAAVEKLETGEVLPEEQGSSGIENVGQSDSQVNLPQQSDDLVTEEVEEIIEENKGDANRFDISIGYIIPESVIATSDQLREQDPVDAETWMATWVEKIVNALES